MSPRVFGDVVASAVHVGVGGAGCSGGERGDVFEFAAVGGLSAAGRLAVGVAGDHMSAEVVGQVDPVAVVDEVPVGRVGHDPA